MLRLRDFVIFTKSFGQSNMVIWDVMIAMSGILEILSMGDLFGFLKISD